MIEIKSQPIKPWCEVAVPGSKSYTHRILIASALSDGVCRIENALISEDTQLTTEALRQMGIQIEEASRNQLLVYGGSGGLQPMRERMHSGTMETRAGSSLQVSSQLSAILGRIHPKTCMWFLNQPATNRMPYPPRAMPVRKAVSIKVKA